MPTGVVKFFNNQRGYGFITPDAGGKNVFVHSTGVRVGGQVLQEGDHVEFNVTEGDKGPQAADVRPAQWPVRSFSIA